MTNGEIVGRVRPYLSSYQRNQTEFIRMDFDVSTIRHYMQQRQRESTLFKRHIEHVSTESQELKQYGKYRFDYAVSKSPFSESGTRCMHQRPTTCPAIVQGKRMLNQNKHNNTGYNRDSGPSTEGSVIYNRRALVLSAIRTRPSTVHSEKQHTAPKGSVLSNVTSPVYRLKVADLSVDGGSVTNQGTVNYSDVVLLPEDTCTIREFLVDEKDKQSDVESVSNEPPRTMYRKPSVPVLVQIDAPDSSEGDSDEETPHNRLSDTRPGSKGSSRQSTNKTSESRGRKKSPSASGREGNRGKTLSPSSAARRPSSVNRGRSKTTAAGTGRDRRNNSGGRRTQLDESPTRLPLPGPHCWVDDVTVSSDVMGEEERGESPSIIINTPKASVYRRPTDKILPDFLCPSSELKSRNFATKMWIRECSFLNADKIIPLI